MIDGLPIPREFVQYSNSYQTHRPYVRVTTRDRGQTVENQLQPPHGAAPDGLVGNLNRIFR